MSHAQDLLAGLSEKQFALLISHLEPLAPNQVRLWIDQELDLESNAYNVTRYLRLRGALDTGALMKAVNALIERHEVLRTIFVEYDDQVYQLVLDATPVLTQVVTLPEHWRDFALRPFDLRAEPPFRALLGKVSDGEHVLLLTLHHIGTDGWSFGIFEHELAEAYQAFSAGSLWHRPEPAQFSHFAQWQRETLTPTEVERQLAYWRSILPANPARVLLASRPLGATGPGRAAGYVVDVPAAAVAAVEELTERFNVSTFAVLQTAVQVLAFRYSGTPNAILGTTTLNRKKPEFESAMGFFVNTVALHTDLSDLPSFGTALARANDSVIGALSHDDVPFDQVVEAVSSRGPLFDIAIELQTAPDGERRWGEVAVEASSLNDKQAKFALALFFLRLPDGLRLMVEYDSSLFDEDYVSSAAHALFTVLIEGARDPGTSIADIPLLDEDAERALRTKRAGADPLDPIRPTSDLIRELGGDRIAVRTQDEQLTFDELVGRAEAIADILVGRDVPAGSFVGLVADRSVDSIVALFGCWLARCAYVAIDPDLPEDRRRYMITDSGVEIILGPKGFESHYAELIDVRVVSATPTPVHPKRTTELDDLAYAIYTSGTTGLPKATLITHANMHNFGAGLRETYEIADWRNETASLNAPLIFDVSVQQILALLGGATLVIIPAHLRLDPDAMLDYVADTQVTLLEAIPPHLHLLMEAGLLTRSDLKLRTQVVGGEALPAPLWGPLGRAEHLKVFNVYGPTECTVNSSFQRVDDRVERPSIGTELPGVSLFVADERQRLVPYGAIGELYIGGKGVGRGYHNRQELTAEKFLDAPWGADGGLIRVYRTGDKVRLAKGGVVEYLGRLDDQVKIRGNRVELGEITAKLVAHPDVTTAVTILDAGDERGPALHSFVVGHAGPKELKQYLRGFLPDYMVPARISALDALPVTVIGKIDYQALNKLAAQTEQAQVADRVEPVDGLERRLVELWCEVLSLSDVDPNSHFFALGGHSLLAARVIAKVRREFGAPLTIAMLLERPTPRRLANHLRGAPVESIADTQHLIELNTAAGDETPVFCMHPLGGDVHVYQELVDALPTGKMVYGVFDAMTDPQTRTTWSAPEEMIGTYTVEIAKVLGGRGCHVVGWSMGGLIAHGVAVELEKLGVPVLSVTIWDAGVSSGTRPRAAEPDWSHGERVVREAPGLAGAEPQACAERAIVASLHNWLFTSWQPGVCDAPLWVVWAGDSLDRGLVTKTDWGRHTRSAIRDERVEATHYSMTKDPMAKELAIGLAYLIADHDRANEDK
ncbi:amino acid adenylation domain-containing protein [Sphaerisporangium sp. NPDC051017]|uniref:non-ribosomal peptide synthetase n=1 Tax=Sphaerisporangium sp. NPDC051017 TaxID=3154636 RepID=UPI0034385553